MSDLALTGAALLIGVAGAPHCAAMCGALGMSASSGLRPQTMALLAGRLAGYAAGGAAVAGGIAGLAALQAAAPWLRPLWTLLHVSCIVFGLWLVATARWPTWLRSRPAVSDGSAPLRFVRRMPPSARAGAAGLCWVALPCGLLQSALLVAALGSGPLGGATIMTAFAIGSAPGLALPLLVRAGWARRIASGRGSRLAVRLAGSFLAGASIFALWHGIGAGGAWCSTAA
jgi:sulfite exporter TauE/SafE